MKLARILDDNPTLDAYRLNYVSNRYVAPLTQHLGAEYGLVWQEWVILFCLAQMADLTATDISDATGRPANTISDGLGKLLRLRLVSRKRDPLDKRAMILALTARGRALYDAMIPLLQATEARIFGALSKPERRQLERLLGKLVHALHD